MSHRNREKQEIWNHGDYTKSSTAIQKSGTEKSNGKRPLGRSKQRWIDEIEKSPMDQGKVKAANMCCGPRRPLKTEKEEESKKYVKVSSAALKFQTQPGCCGSGFAENCGASELMRR